MRKSFTIVLMVFLHGCMVVPKVTEEDFTGLLLLYIETISKGETSIRNYGDEDFGGLMREYVVDVMVARNRSITVRIPISICASSCTLLLGSGDVRLSPNTVIGVHEPRLDSGSGYESGTKSSVGMSVLRRVIPACAVDLFDSRGALDSGDVTWFSGAEVLDACPGIIKEY